MTIQLIEVQEQSLYSKMVQAVTSFESNKWIESKRDVTRVNEQATLSLFRQAVIKQDQSAWREIWQGFQSGITRKIRRELAGWNVDSEELKDLTQTVFIKFWQDTSTWNSVDHLYTQNKQEGILSRLHSTAIFTVQRFRQKTIRRWIPLIRANYPTCSNENRAELQTIAGNGLSARYRDIFMLHLRECQNNQIAGLMEIELKQVSIQINRAWERYIYVLLNHRRHNPDFHDLFQYLITDKAGGN